MTDCPKCDETGWKPIMVNGERRVTPCDCRQRARLETEKLQPGGFQQIGRLSDRVIERLKTNGPELVEQVLARHVGDLTPEEIQIARLIGRRVGQASAIRIADLIKALSGGHIDRDIKAMVEHLRTLAKLPIAATKVPPYGYFIPATDTEGREFHDRHMREAIKHIRISQLFHQDRDLMQELRGQLGLEAR